MGSDRPKVELDFASSPGTGRQESDRYYNRGLKLAGRDLHRFSHFSEIVRR